MNNSRGPQVSRVIPINTFTPHTPLGLALVGPLTRVTGINVQPQDCHEGLRRPHLHNPERDTKDTGNNTSVLILARSSTEVSAVGIKLARAANFGYYLSSE